MCGEMMTIGEFRYLTYIPIAGVGFEVGVATLFMLVRAMG